MVRVLALILMMVPGLVSAQTGSVTDVVLAGPGSKLANEVKALTQVGIESVVRVIRADASTSSGSRKCGSGVMVEPGWVLTCAGVVGNAKEVLIASVNGDTLLAEVTGVDRRTNLALIHAPGLNLKVPKINPSALVLPGTFVLAVGIGSTAAPHSTFGSVVVDDGPSLGYSDMEMVQTTTPVFPGYTGGALLNPQGELIGILSGVLEPTGDLITPVDTDLLAGFLDNGRLLTITPGLTVSLPIGRCMELAQQLKAKGFVERAYLGLEVELTQSSPGDLPSPNVTERPHGVRVHRVVPGGPVARVGLLPGDLILSFGDRRVESPDDLAFQVASRSPGMVAPIRYWRRGAVQQSWVVLDQAPAVVWQSTWDAALIDRNQTAPASAR